MSCSWQSFKVETRVGEREYDAIQREIFETPGQTFTASDVEVRYNICKVLGRIHLDFLVGFCNSYVDFKTISVGNRELQALLKLPHPCPWLKICLLCDNYMTVEPKVKMHGKGVADNWKASDIDDIVTTFTHQQLCELEVVACSLVETYGTTLLKFAQMETVHKTQCRLVYRIGAVLRGKKRTDFLELVAEVEHNLRAKLGCQLPKAILEEHHAIPAKSKSSAEKALVVVVDEAPALTFNDQGQVQSDMASIARAKGIACRLYICKLIRCAISCHNSYVQTPE